MNKGHVLLHRALLDSQIFASQIGLKIWIWLLFKAAYNKRYVPVKIGKGETTVTLEIGELLFGRFKAEEALNIDGSTIYKWLGKMEEMGMIKIKSNTHYSIVTIENYATYQKLDNEEVATIQQPSDSHSSTIQQPSDSQVTHISPLNIDKHLKPLNKKDKVKRQAVITFDFTDFKYPDFLKTETRALLKDYIQEIRERKHKLDSTDRSIKMLINSLVTFSENNDEQAKCIIENAYLKEWKGFYKVENKTFGKTEITPEQKVIVYVNENCEYWKRQDPKKWKTALFEFCETIGFPAYANYSKNLEEGRQITDPIEFRDFILKGA